MAAKEIHIQVTLDRLKRLYLGMYVYTYTYICMTIMNLKESKEKYMEGFGGRKGKG